MKGCMILLAGAIMLTACGDGNNKRNLTEMENMYNTTESIFPLGETASPDFFNGKAFVNVLLQKPGYSVGNVVFEPGCRNNWHSHPVGQVLLVTQGEGWYQEKGEPARRITKGDVVDIPADVIHWHGATRDNRLEHIAITDNGETGNVVWLDPVTVTEYDAL